MCKIQFSINLNFKIIKKIDLELWNKIKSNNPIYNTNYGLYFLNSAGVSQYQNVTYSQ